MSTLLRPGRATAAPSLSGIDADLDDVFELSPHGLLLFDDTGRIVHLNAAMQPLLDGAARMHELPEPLREALGWPERLPPVRQQREHLGWLTLAGQRRHLRLRVRGLRARNTSRWLLQAEDLAPADDLRLARQELAAVLDTVGAAVATHDPERGWLTTALPQSAEPPNAAQRGIRRDVVEPDGLPAYEQLQTALRQRQRTEVHYAVRHTDLGRRWLATRVQPEAGGNLLSAVTRDVTPERRAAQDAERLACVLNGASVGLAVQRGLHLLRASPAFAALLGTSEAALADQTLDALLLAAGCAPARVAEVVAQWQASGTFEGELLLPAAPQPALALRLTRTASELTLAQLSDLSAQRQREAEIERLARERSLLFNQPGVGIVIQEGGRITRANAAMGELLGRPAEALRGMAVADLYADDRAHLAYSSQERRDLQHHGRARGERQLRREGDSLVWVHASIHPLNPHDLTGGTLTVFVSAEDGRRARESLLMHTDRTRAILDSVLVGIVTVGAQGIEWMNRSARRMFGGELAEFLGQPIAVAAPEGEADHPLRRSDWLAVLKEGQSETFECRIAGRDGRAFWVVGNVVVTGRADEDGDGGQITFALLDIQRRREAEQQIAQARASLQRIIETAPLAIALFDARTQQVLQLNQAMTAFARRPAGDILGRAPALWLPGSEAAALAADLHEALSAHDAVHRELSRAPASEDEAARIWDMRIVSLRASGGEEQVLLVASDVTEQRAAEQTRLDAAIAQRDMLVREVHHRIKNNLQGVAGLLQQNVQRHPEAASAIAEAVGQVHAIAQVHGLQVGASGPLRIKGVVQAIAGSVQRMFGRPITFSLEGEAPHRLALSEADSIPIALTVNELLTNAIKHSQGDAPILCAVTTGAADVSIRITNPGTLAPGISMETVPAGISGLGLVRALLPRKGARIGLAGENGAVHAELHLTAPAITILEAL